MSDKREVRATLLVSGRVQGVFYRATAMETAQGLGLVGWVRNLPGGDVEAVVEGSEEAVDDFIAWARQGPPSAQVDAVRVNRGTATGEFRTFQVTR